MIATAKHNMIMKELYILYILYIHYIHYILYLFFMLSFRELQYDSSMFLQTIDALVWVS